MGIKEPETETKTLGEILGDSIDLSAPIDYFEMVEISWGGNGEDRRSGALHVSYKVWGGGSSSYFGIEHPDGVCKGGGICHYCGRTLM